MPFQCEMYDPPAIVTGSLFCWPRPEKLSTSRVVAVGATVLTAIGNGTGINTEYPERLNATMRSAVCAIRRRVRALARGEGVCTEYMNLASCTYNF